MEKELLKQHICSFKIKIIEAMEMIDRNASGIIFAVDEDDRLIGCVTDGDIRRWILKAGSLEDSIDNIMSRNPYYLSEGDEASAEILMHEKVITALPIVDSERHITNIIRIKDKWGDRKRSHLMKGVPVVIMAGGKGTRLYPYTNILPKPLIPIGGIPIVERIINRFYDSGIDRLYMTVNYKKGMIKSYFSEQEFPYTIDFVEEDEPLGTGGSIKLINDKFEVPVFVTNCDSLILTDYGELYDHHKSSGNDITMVVALKKYVIPYGVIESGENGEVVSMEEKPTQSYFINTGMYVINPEVIDLIPSGQLYHMTHLMDAVMKNGGKVGTYPISEDSFLDMGEFDEMKRMEEKLSAVPLK